MMQRSKSVLVPFAFLCLTTLAMTGCGATSTPPPEQPNETPPGQSNEISTEQPNDVSTDATNTGGEQGEATFRYGDNVYTAKLQFCALSDGQDALFHGVAHDEAGNKVGYLDGGFGVDEGNLEGEARIDFGASAQFESTDEFIAIGSAFDGIVATAFSDTGWNILGSGWDQNGTQQSGTNLRIIC